MIKDGEITKIGGINVLMAPFLGKTIAAGAGGLDKDESFDFSGVNAVWVHKEAVAFPYNQGLSNIFVLPSQGNIHNFHKFLVNSKGGEALRPTAVIGFNITQASK